MRIQAALDSVEQRLEETGDRGQMAFNQMLQGSAAEEKTVGGAFARFGLGLLPGFDTAMDVQDLRYDSAHRDEVSNWQLAMDYAGLIPVFGEVADAGKALRNLGRAAEALDTGGDTTRTLNQLEDAAEALKAADNMGEALDTGGDILNEARRAGLAAEQTKSRRGAFAAPALSGASVFVNNLHFGDKREAQEALAVQIAAVQVHAAGLGVVVACVVIQTAVGVDAGAVDRDVPSAGVGEAKAAVHLHRREQMEKLTDRGQLVRRTDRVRAPKGDALKARHRRHIARQTERAETLTIGLERQRFGKSVFAGIRPQRAIL